MPTYIDEIDDEFHRERLRQEFLQIIESRRNEAGSSFTHLATYSSVVYSGAIIAMLSYISNSETETPSFASLLALFAFTVSLLSHAYFLYKNSQLHAARWRYAAEVVQRFFVREATVEEVICAIGQLKAGRLYQVMFWVPFGFALAGFASIGLSMACSFYFGEFWFCVAIVD